MNVTVRNEFGTFCNNGSVESPSLDVTSALATDLADGLRSFLFRLSGSGGATNTYAQFDRELESLSVVYLLP